MYESRNLQNEVEELGIVSMETFGDGSQESAFAALDVIREHNKRFPVERMEKMAANAKREAYESMAGTRDRRGDS